MSTIKRGDKIVVKIGGRRIPGKAVSSPASDGSIQVSYNGVSTTVNV